jgi:lipopolysaccharide export system permease protein
MPAGGTDHGTAILDRPVSQRTAFAPESGMPDDIAVDRLRSHPCRAIRWARPIGVDARDRRNSTMIINRYIAREILRPTIAVCGALVTIFVSYTAARYLADAVDGVLPARTIASLVLLRTAVAVEVLLPITLFLSVVLAIGRLYADSEVIALAASGVGPSRILRVVGGLAGLLAVLVAGLSLYVRPWAYDESYRLRAQAGAEIDVARVEPGRFFERPRGGHVLFVEQLDRERHRLEGVFLRSEDGDAVQVIYARHAYQRSDTTGGDRVLVMTDGRQYKFARSEVRDRVLAFDTLEMRLKDEEITPEYRRKAAPTRQLARSRDPKDVAELQWRLSTPLSTILLALFGVPLGRAAPRHGKHARFVTAAVVYAVYYNVMAMAKTSVEHGIVDAVPGIWWVPALQAVVLVAVLRWWAR